MYVIKKFIKEKMNDRLFRALFLSAVVFALMASFSCPLSILRPFFGLFVSASLYFVPVWLPSKFQIREQRETKIGVHPIAWAIWQSGYCFITIMYLLIIINTSHTGIPVWSFAFPAVVGSGYLVSYVKNPRYGSAQLIDATESGSDETPLERSVRCAHDRFAGKQSGRAKS